MSAKLISIVGPPAVGKTTLAERLAAELPAELTREDYAGNPFLAESYVGTADARLPAQLFFLMSRVKQLAGATWPAEGVVVSDYGYCQDRIYAEAKLDAVDLRLYNRVARRVDGLIHTPDVMISLDASEQTLLDRIAGRGRPFERAMTAEFLSGMREAYNGILREAAFPVIAVDCDEADVLDDSVRRELIRELRTKL
jgi:deoxyguanosine kinase